MEIGVGVWNVKFDGAGEYGAKNNTETYHEYNREWHMTASRDERTHVELFSSFWRGAHELSVEEFEMELEES
jgi:hypothetical protein